MGTERDGLGGRQFIKEMVMAGSKLSKKDALSALRQMLTIRRAEEKVMHFASDYDGLIRGHYHVYIGQEATGVAVCNALGPQDYVFTTHRNHGHVIARGGELGPVLAEIIGRTTGYNKGRGGTFHVIAPHLGILQTSGVVGGCMPLATGAAFSAKKRGTDQISVVFFGDGVLEEGAFYESINMASLWKLPIIFACENNDVPRGKRKGGSIKSESLAASKLVDISKAFNIPSVIVDGADVSAVSAVMTDAVAKVRKGGGPVFIESRITRWPGNYGAFPTLHGGDYQLDWIYDPKSAPKELRSWVDGDDPVALLARDLIASKAASAKDIEDMDGQVKAEIEAGAQFALESPEPEGKDALNHVFA